MKSADFDFHVIVSRDLLCIAVWSKKNVKLQSKGVIKSRTRIYIQKGNPLTENDEMTKIDHSQDKNATSREGRINVKMTRILAIDKQVPGHRSI